MQIRHVDHSDESDQKDLETIKAEEWQKKLLDLNPNYVQWGPHEDYMASDGNWTSPLVFQRWKEMFHLDELNEVVNFYFYLNRADKSCRHCDAGGYNSATQAIADSFYAHSSPTGIGWNDKITDDEAEALFVEGRLKTKMTAAEVNAAQSGSYIHGQGVVRHDGINRWILIETRAKRLGVYGACEHCNGRGRIFTSDKATVGLVLWLLHPRKGASRGVEVKEIQESELPEIFAFLKEAAARNANRFSKIP